MLRFADDIALITKEEKEMETALEVMQKCFEEYDLRINWKKTKVMICNKSQQSQRLQIKVGNNFIEQVNSYKYLGNLSPRMERPLKKLELG